MAKKKLKKAAARKRPVPTRARALKAARALEAMPLAPSLDQPSFRPAIEMAIQSGLGDVALKLMEAEDRRVEDARRRPFTAAMAKAFAEFTPVKRTRIVRMERNRTRWHEDLEAIAKMANPILARHGLGYHFDVESTDLSKPIRVTCFVTHESGYERTATLPSQFKQRPGMEPDQVVAAIVTFLSRYTLKAALGVVVEGDDSDGDGFLPITPAQVDEISNLVVNSGINIVTFLDLFGVPSISDLPSAEFEKAVTMLQQRIADKNNRLANFLPEIKGE